MGKVNTATAWSYSRLMLFESCARQYKYRTIDKLPEKKAPAMQRGITIHNEIAKYLEGKAEHVPDSGYLFKDQLQDLKSFNPLVEQQWAFTKGYKNVSWFDKKVRLRIIVDAAVEYSDNTADIIDHKTGKFKEDNPEYDEQMDLFAAGMIKRNPSLTNVTTRLWFLDSGDEVIREVSKAQALDKLDELEDRADIMLDTERFPPNPSWKCRYCAWNADDGGQCEFK